MMLSTSPAVPEVIRTWDFSLVCGGVVIFGLSRRNPSLQPEWGVNSASREGSP